MDPNQRPHSRDKEVASGTAHVGKGEQVAAGGPVGGQNSRPGSKPATGSKREGSALPVRSGGSLLTLIIVIVVVFLLLRSCSGGAAGSSVQLQEPEDSTSGTFGTQVAGSAVSLDYVLGILYDEDAIMTDFQLESSATTPLEARKRYRNIWWSFAKNAINDFTENAIIFTMEDPSEGGDG